MNMNPSFILTVIALIFACLSYVWPQVHNVSLILLCIAVLLWAIHQ